MSRDERAEIIALLKQHGFRYVENDLRVGSTWLPRGPVGAARYFNGKVVVDVTGYLVNSHPFGQCNQVKTMGFRDFREQLTGKKSAA